MKNVVKCETCGDTGYIPNSQLNIMTFGKDPDCPDCTPKQTDNEVGYIEKQYGHFKRVEKIKKHNEVDCKTCDDEKEVYYPIKKEFMPCPDCTDQQTEDYDNEFNKAIKDYTCDEVLEDFFFRRGYLTQTAKLKQQAEEIELLKKQNAELQLLVDYMPKMC